MDFLNFTNYIGTTNIRGERYRKYRYC